MRIQSRLGPSRSLVAIVLIATSVSGCNATGSDAWGSMELVEDLAANGGAVRLEVSPYAPSPFLPGATTEQVLCIDGQEAIVYEYDTEDLRREDSAKIMPDGGFEVGHFDLRRGRVMWWAKGRVIVNYNSADPRIVDSLSAVAGNELSPAGEATGDLSIPPEPSRVCS